MTGKEILDLLMGDNDAEAATVRDYLKELLFSLWAHGEGFSGKRPFGNSGWEYELYGPLEVAGITDRSQQNEAIFNAIEAL